MSTPANAIKDFISNGPSTKVPAISSNTGMQTGEDGTVVQEVVDLVAVDLTAGGLFLNDALGSKGLD